MDRAASTSNSDNKFTAWGEVTPLHNKLVDTLLRVPCHVLATMRTKTEYALEQGADSKTRPRKVGMAPIQRDGVDYEVAVVADLSPDHVLTVTKSRLSFLDERRIERPGEALGMEIREYLARQDGAADELYDFTLER